MTNGMLKVKCGTRVIYNDVSQILPITNKKDFDDFIIYSENKSNKIKSKLKWEPMSEEWKNNCKNNFWFQNTLEDMKAKHPSMDDRLFLLKNHLLEFAGEAVCLPGYEEDLENILSYGQFWLGNNIKMMRGLPSHCHANASRLWENNKEKCRICTGYALSPDGMWRQHSWVIWMKPRSNQIVETTVPRIAYFGFVMTDEQCEEFAENNF